MEIVQETLRFLKMEVKNESDVSLDEKILSHALAPAPSATPVGDSSSSVEAVPSSEPLKHAWQLTKTWYKEMTAAKAFDKLGIEQFSRMVQLRSAITRKFSGNLEHFKKTEYANLCPCTVSSSGYATSIGLKCYTPDMHSLGHHSPVCYAYSVVKSAQETVVLLPLPSDITQGV